MIVATLVAVAVASVGTVFVFGVHSWLVRATKMRVVASVAAITLTIALYIASIFVCFSLPIVK